MSDDVPVAHQSVNSARYSAPRHRGDVSDARACVARERPVVAIARTEGMTRRWLVTARRDDVTGRRCELPPNAYDLAAGVCEVPPIEDVILSRLWVITAGSGHAGGGVRAEIAVRGSLLSNSHRSRHGCTRCKRDIGSDRVDSGMTVI